MARTFELRILKASWGIAIDLTAEAQWRFGAPEGLMKAGDRVWLDASAVQLGPADIEQLRLGLSRVSPQVAAKDPERQIIVRIIDVSYTPTDYQAEGMAAAMVGWASEEFDLPRPELAVQFDKMANRYVFPW